MPPLAKCPVVLICSGKYDLSPANTALVVPSTASAAITPSFKRDIAPAFRNPVAPETSTTHRQDLPAGCGATGTIVHAAGWQRLLALREAVPRRGRFASETCLRSRPGRGQARMPCASAWRCSSMPVIMPSLASTAGISLSICDLTSALAEQPALDLDL